MSMNLKQLMEDDAGRPVSPAPVDEVLAGGWSRVRRRRIVGAAAAAVAAVVAIAIPVGLSQNDSTDEPIDRPERSDSLTFTRANGTAFTIEGAEVRCGRSTESDAPLQAVFVEGSAQEFDPGREPTEPLFLLEAFPRDVAGGDTITLPHSYEYNDPSGAVLFVYDAETGNELSSSAEGASGTIVFERASCDPSPSVDVTIDATLGSEFFQGRRVEVEGQLRLGN
jgi:hypothetical protein